MVSGPASTPGAAHAALDRGMWRFREHLPVRDPGNIVTLGEGGTPLLPAVGRSLAELGLSSVHLKAEHQNPTGSFKDRIAAVAASLIVERRLGGAVGTSSGNGGAAMAAYGARADRPVILFTVGGIVDGKLDHILAHGASTSIVRTRPGASTSPSLAPMIARVAEEQGWLAFLTGARFAPEAMQGAETIADELAEQLPAADWVYVPVGGGGLLGSIWRGYQRAPHGRRPRLVGVQPEGCPTLARAVAGDRSPLDQPITTTVSGLQVGMLFDYGAIDAITGSGGHVVEVSDADSWAAQRLLAREEGVFVEPAGATALAGLLADVRAGRVAPEERVVVVTTGAGHKDRAAVGRLVAENPATEVDPEDIASVLAAVTATSRP